MTRRLPFLFLAFFLCAAYSPAGPIVTNTTSESSAEIDTVNTVPATQSEFQYSTEIIGMLQGGPVVYNQTFGAAFSDPSVQAAITAAEGILTGDGAASFNGPTLESNIEMLLSSSVSTMQTGDELTNVTSATTTYIGPETIFIGDYGICQAYNASNNPPVSECSIGGTAFDLGPGSGDIDNFITSFVTITDTVTTTNTYEISQVYDIEGLPASAVPEPGTLGLMIAAGAACVLKRRLS